MLGLLPERPAGRPFRLLCLGAHSDDIEIGCGGTVLRLLAELPDVEVYWAVFSAGDERRRAEAEAGASVLLRGAGKVETRFHGFRDGYFPAEFAGVKQAVEELKGWARPDLVLTHNRHDRHQDHRTLAELTWNSFRNHLVLAYEIPKFDGDLGNPNLFVPLTGAQAQAKVDALMAGFESQRGKGWFTPDTFHGLLRLRGIQAASPTGLAEGFYAEKITLFPPPTRD